MPPIIIQNGRAGLNDPRNADAHVITITRGTYSRTGRSSGNVDQRYGVRVCACRASDTVHGRVETYSETLFAPERWDPAAKPRLGGPGAFVDQEPAQHEVDAAIQRAREHLERGVGPVPAVQRRAAPAGPPEHDLCPVAVGI